MINIIVATALMSGGLNMTCNAQETTLFADATAVWQFGGRDEPGVSASGNVRLGVAISGAERQASLLRGGEGLVASFTGGHLRVGGDRNINLTGKHMTLYARMRVSGGNESVPIFARDDASDANGVLLSRDKDGFRYLWRTRPAKEMVLPGVESSEQWAKWPEAVRKGVIPLVGRLPEKEKTAWHDVIMRFDNAKLELFIDGNLLGQKHDIWEGGHRVPFIVRWPGKVKPGTHSASLVSFVDVMATMAEILHYPLPADAGPDSFSFLHALTGESTATIRRESQVYQACFGGLLAIRQGSWVFVPAQGGDGYTYTGADGKRTISAAELGFVNSDYTPDGKLKPDAPPGQLYDLSSDLSQKTNLYRQYPERVAEMTKLLKDIKTRKQTRP